MAEASYEYSVFVNCPFDAEYRPIFRAIVFTIHDCGFAARSALEVTDASQVRIEKIGALIAASKFGLHDISRTELDSVSGLPRFNMPLELGLFLGAKKFGPGKQKAKTCLILDVERYRFQKFISDIAGQDIAAHGGRAADAIRLVRNWLSDAAGKSVRLPGGAAIAKRFEAFADQLPTSCKELGLVEEELTFNDYLVQVEEWLKLNARIPS